MIDDRNKNEIIEQYLLGELSGDLLDEFKQKLTADHTFRTEVALEQAVLRNLKKAGRQEWRLKFETFHQQMDDTIQASMPPLPERKIQLFARRYVWMAAASIVLIIACTFIFLTFFNTQFDKDAIFEAYYTPYPSTQVFRSSPTEKEIEKEAFVAYHEENYQQSIELFRQVLATKPDETILFYLGNAYLAADMPQEAIQTFTAYLSEYTEFKNEATWNLSLAYIKNGEIQEAKQLLEELAAHKVPANKYSRQASEVLKKMP